MCLYTFCVSLQCFQGVKRKEIPDIELSATGQPNYGVSQGIQIFKEVNTELGKPLVHSSAYQQASGEAVYIDDMQALSGKIYMSKIVMICLLSE